MDLDKVCGESNRGEEDGGDDGKRRKKEDGCDDGGESESRWA